MLARSKRTGTADSAVPGGANLLSYAALLWPLFNQCTVYLDLLTANEVQIIAAIPTMKNSSFCFYILVCPEFLVSPFAEQVLALGLLPWKERACHPCLLQRRSAAWPSPVCSSDTGTSDLVQTEATVGQVAATGRIWLQTCSSPATLLMQTLPEQRELLSRAHNQRYQPEQRTLEVFLMVWSLPSVFWIGRCRFLLEIVLFHPGEL